MSSPPQTTKPDPLRAYLIAHAREALLRPQEVAELIGMSVSWVYQEAKDGRFPPQVGFMSAARWRLSEVRAWMRQDWPEAAKVAASSRRIRAV